MKPIIMESFIPNIMQAVEKSLKQMKACDTKVNISWDISTLFKNLVKDVLMPKIDIDILAWMKMTMLTESADKEIAWHCLVDRPEPDHFIIRDVLMYPQEVTATAVDSDDARYHTWLDSIPDEDFARMRGQGHSHVRMATSPSGADTAYYQKMLATVRDYYIFMILNKRGELWINLYDVARNIIYEEKDLEVAYITPDGTDLQLWAENAMKMIKQPPPPPPVEKKEWSGRPVYQHPNLGYENSMTGMNPTPPSSNISATPSGSTDYWGRPIYQNGALKPINQWTDEEINRFEARERMEALERSREIIAR